MPSDHDLLVRNAYLYDREDVYDIAVDGSTIARVAPAIEADAEQEIDAEGNLVGPGFVDSHIHLDKVFSARGERFPKYNDRGTDFDQITRIGDDYYANTSTETLTENAVKLGHWAASNGTLYMRTHVNVGGSVGMKALDAIVEARNRLEGVLDLQIVSLPPGGILANEAAVRESLDRGADLVGGVNPAKYGDDVMASIETWFDIAEDHGVEIDPHIEHPSTLGVQVLHWMADKTIEHDYGGMVTASHSYCLAEMHRLYVDTSTPELDPAELKSFQHGQLDAALDRFQEAGMKFVTCHPSTRPGMPIHGFFERGTPIGWGCDNISDWVNRHTQPDALLGALINTFKLDYNLYSFATNQGLDLLWRMATDGGAQVLSIDDYAIEEGNPADLVVFDEPSPQWAIINLATRQHVVKDGQVIAQGGEYVGPDG